MQLACDPLYGEQDFSSFCRRPLVGSLVRRVRFADWADLGKPLPPSVGYLCVYSRSDGIVDWRACLDEGAEHLEVRSSHCGMSLNPDAYRATARALQSFCEPAARTASRRATKGALR